MDTYKIGTTTNSTSTMHKLATKPISLDLFETDDMDKDLIIHSDSSANSDFTIEKMSNSILSYCEALRQKYLETKDTKYWKELVRWLPEGWLQTRAWSANYAVLRNIYHWRKDHKLIEWHQFCGWIETLLYSDELILFDNE